MHLHFELWLNRKTFADSSVEFSMFLKFLSTLKNLTAYRTEWQIFGEEECLAGSIDFVARTAAAHGNLWSASMSFQADQPSS
jgi:hypothetical protein